MEEQLCELFYSSLFSLDPSRLLNFHKSGMSFTNYSSIATIYLFILACFNINFLK